MYHQKYKPEQQVQIFTDPVTCAIPEGQATLKHFISASGGLEYWSVVFDDCPDRQFERFIKAPVYNEQYRKHSPYRFPGDWGPVIDSYRGTDHPGENNQADSQTLE